MWVEEKSLGVNTPDFQPLWGQRFGAHNSGHFRSLGALVSLITWDWKAVSSQRPALRGRAVSCSSLCLVLHTVGRTQVFLKWLKYQGSAQFCKTLALEYTDRSSFAPFLGEVNEWRFPWTQRSFRGSWGQMNMGQLQFG